MIEWGQRLLGYRLVIRRARFPSILTSTRRGSVSPEFEIDIEWSNLGVGRLYRPARLWAALSDDSGRVIWEGPDHDNDLRVGTFIHGNTVRPADLARDDAREQAWISQARIYGTRAHFALPAKLPSGFFNLTLQLRVGEQKIALGQSGGGLERRYEVGRIEILSQPSLWDRLFLWKERD